MVAEDGVLPGELPPEQRPEDTYAGKPHGDPQKHSRWGNSQCKGPGVGTQPGFLGQNSGVRREEEMEQGEDGGEQTGPEN